MVDQLELAFELILIATDIFTEAKKLIVRHLAEIDGTAVDPVDGHDAR